MSINETEYKRQLESIVNVLKVMIQQQPESSGTGTITIDETGRVNLYIELEDGSATGEIAQYDQFAQLMDEVMSKHYEEGGV